MSLFLSFAVIIHSKLVKTKDSRGAFMINVMYERNKTQSLWGVLCDDGFGDTEAKLICRHYGYKVRKYSYIYIYL